MYENLFYTSRRSAFRVLSCCFLLAFSRRAPCTIRPSSGFLSFVASPPRGSHGVRLRLLTQVATAPMIRVGSFLVVPDFRLMNHQYPAKILAKPGFIGEHSHFQDLPSSNHVSLWHFRIFPNKVPRLAIEAAIILSVRRLSSNHAS